MIQKKIYTTALLAILLVGQADAKKDNKVTLTFKGNSVAVTNNAKDSLEVTSEGAHVKIVSAYNNPVTVTLQGTSDDGSIVLKNDGRVKLEMKNLNLTSQERTPLWLKNKKRVEIEALQGTKNSLTIVECKDTATQKAAVIFAKENLKLSGKGQLNIVAEGKGCKGITAKGNLTIDDLTLNVETKGDNWNESRGKFGGMGGGFGGGFGGFGGDDNHGDRPDFGGGFPGGGFGGFGGGFPGGFDRPEGEEVPDSLRGRRGRGRGGFGGPRGFGRPEGEEMPDSLRDRRRGGRGRGGFDGGMPDFGGFGGGFPGFGEFNPDSIPEGGFPGFPGGFGGGMPDFGGGFGGFPGFGGGGGHGNPKGISAAGDLTINSGQITVKTAYHGGEGLESKQILTINGGTIDIDAVDDAINCAKQIVFNGGKVMARSKTNDAVDCNGNGEAIIINGGEIYGWSSNGSPEEGMDSDFNPLLINGGRIFSMGGGMMGDEPSKPSNETAKQPTYLLTGLSIEEGQLIEVYEGTEDKRGKKIDSFKAPFNIGRCSSIISYPEFKVGSTYTVKVGDKCHTLELKENYTTNSEGRGGGFGGWGGW